MTTTQRSTVVGVFDNRAEADRAVDDLRSAGFRAEQIGVAVRNDDKADPDETASKMATGAATGALAGAGVGGLVGLGILTGLIPGIGPAIAAGTMGVILANAAGGAAIAGIAGALIGLGIPDDEAAHYEKEFKAGRTIVTVRDVEDRYDDAWAILQRHGAFNKQFPRKRTRKTATAKTATRSRAKTEAEKTMELREEELHARKQPVRTGEVRVRKDVVTETQTLDVPVTREEVVIERHPVGHKTSPNADIRPGEEVRIPVMEEQVRVAKDTVLKEEVNVGKRKVSGTKRVSGTVRKEKARVEREGKVDVNENSANQ